MEQTGKKKYLYWIRPEVAGGWGPGTTVSNMQRVQNGEDLYPIVERLDYHFEGWLGDELLTTTPCYIASDGITADLTAAGLTGFVVGPVDISMSEDFRRHSSAGTLPKFHRLQISGRVLISEERDAYSEWSGDDFCLGARAELIVSARALDTIRIIRVANARLVTLPPLRQRTQKRVTPASQ